MSTDGNGDLPPIEPDFSLPEPELPELQAPAIVALAPEATTAILEPVPPEALHIEALPEEPAPEPEPPQTLVEDTTPEILSADVEASFPFNVRIEGNLDARYSEKLLEIVSQAAPGLSKMDLEPQIEAGRILIPRVSEYVAVLIVQALKSADVKMELFPTDEYAEPQNAFEHDARMTTQVLEESAHAGASSSEEHPAEAMPVTTEPTLQGWGELEVLGVVVATGGLNTQSVEARFSAEYQALLESLQTELKYKAFRKGAHALTGFRIELTPLAMPTRYRLHLLATAVRRSPPPV